MLALLAFADGCTRLGAMLACKSFDSLADTLKTVPDFTGRIHLFGDLADFDRVEAWMVPKITELTSGPSVVCRGRVPPGLHIQDVKCKDRTFYSEEFIPLGKRFVPKIFCLTRINDNHVSTRYFNSCLGTISYRWKFGG
jgi:hypothetical protein